jgi:glycosyltransferase involved in cell wall biosynthesis
MDLDSGSYCLLSSQDHSADQDFIGRLPAPYHVLPPEIHIRRGMARYGILKFNTMLGVFGRGWNIFKILKAENCDVLVAGTGNLIDLPAACIAAALKGIAFYPYLFDDFAYQWADPIYRDMTSRFETVLFKNASGVIVPNEFLKHEVRQRHDVDAAIVRNCCERSHLESKTIRKMENLSGQFHIAYTGAVYHVNFGAFRNLIAALKSPRLAQVYLHMYTAQPADFLKSEGICGQQVIQNRHLPPNKVTQAQHSADILFIPFSFNCSVPEIVKTSAPGKFGDYLASGTPILAHLPGDSFVSWYLKEYDCGIVVDQDDPDFLADAILTLIEDPSLRLKLSENAKKRAQIDFNPELARMRFLSAIGLK